MVAGCGEAPRQEAAAPAPAPAAAPASAPAPAPSPGNAVPPLADRAAAQAALERGKALYATGDLPKARAAFEEATRLDATFALAWNWLGRSSVLASAGMSYSRARTAFDRALALDPQLIEAHWGLGLAAYGLVEYEVAERELAAFLAGAGETTAREMRGEAEHFLGVLARLRGDPDAALACFERAAKLHPRFPDTHYERGLTLEAAGRTEQAVAAFEATLELERNHLPSWFRLARLYRALGRDADAVRAEKIHRTLNHLYDDTTGRDLREPQRRLQWWGELSALDPKNVKARLEFARALAELQRDAEARLAVDDLLRQLPATSEAHLMGIELAWRAGDQAGAAARVKAWRAAVPSATATALPPALRSLWSES